MFEYLRSRAIRELMTESNVIPSSFPVSRALGLIKSENLYEIFIDDGEKMGMATVRDLLRVSDITSMKLSLLMSYVPKLPIDYPVGKASRIMARYRIRALPIVQDGKAIGKITALSILKAMGNEMPSDIRTGSVMTPHPITINRDDPASKAKTIMNRRKIDHLPVLHDEKIYGMVTSSDLLFSYIPPESLGKEALGAQRHRRLDFPVDGVLSKKVATCSPEDRLKGVLDGMLRSNSTYALVKLWDEIQGIVTYRDIVTLVSEEEVNEEVPVYIVGLPEDPFEAELAKDKFRDVVALLRKAFPEVEEARSKISIKGARGGKRRYEVDVMVHTPYRSYTYTEAGWDLPRIYDMISDRLKRLLTQRPSRRKSPYRVDYP